MSFDRPLRGGCQCGRNRYIIQFPQDATEVAKVLFNSSPSHRMSQASPLTAFIRVPLTWYRSTTFAYLPDETSAMIHKVYCSPDEQHAMRHFCGFCGTPLSYWSEEPRTEAEFIQLTLGSLSAEDLADLDDLGLLPDEDEPDETPGTPKYDDMSADDDELVIYNGRETLGALPWFETLMEGSKLGSMRMSKGAGKSRDGSVRVEWEIVEWTEDDGSDNHRSGKRKLQDRDGPEDPSVPMEGLQQ